MDPAKVKQSPHGWLDGVVGNLAGLMTYNNLKHLNPADLYPARVEVANLMLYANN